MGRALRNYIRAQKRFDAPMAGYAAAYWGMRTLAKAGVPAVPLPLSYLNLDNWYPYGNALSWHGSPWTINSPFNSYSLVAQAGIQSSGGPNACSVSRLCGGLDLSATTNPFPTGYNGPVDYVISLVVNSLLSSAVIDFYLLLVSTIPNNQYAILSGATLLASVTAAQFGALPGTKIAIRLGANLSTANKFVLQGLLRNNSAPPLLELPIILGLGSSAPENSISWEAGIALTPPPPGTGGIPGSAEANLPLPLATIGNNSVALSGCQIACCQWTLGVTHGTAFASQLQLTPIIMGASPANWTATGLPSGVTLNASTGVLSGTVASMSITTATVTVKDAGGSVIVTTSLTITAV